MGPRLAVLKIFINFTYNVLIYSFFSDFFLFSIIKYSSVIPEIGVMIPQKVRKKKSLFLMLSFSAVKNHGAKVTYTSQYSVCEHEEVF